jgi:hypothetical protein
MATYHLNKKGYYTPCKATTQACPLSGKHISETEYAELKNSSDPTVEHNFTASPDSYYTNAKEAYEAIVAENDTADKIQKATDEYTGKLYAKEGIDPNTSPYMVDREAEEAVNHAKKILRNHYIKAGVNPTKASYLADDAAKLKNGIKPIIRKTDKLDPEIESKTLAAANAANEDPDFVNAVSESEAKKELGLRTRAILSKRDEFKRDLTRNVADGRAYVGISAAVTDRAVANLREANAWKKAGVPDEAKACETSRVLSSDLTTDAKGKINNAWAEVDGKVEKIVGYVPPKQHMMGYSGHLVTESGKTVSSGIHYANFGHTTSGVAKVILGAKQGKELKADRFNIHSIIDSGD